MVNDRAPTAATVAVIHETREMQLPTVEMI